MALFDTLGFHWDRSAVPTSVASRSIERACFRFHKMLRQCRRNEHNDSLACRRGLSTFTRDVARAPPQRPLSSPAI
ncbi:MAG: hypothetical protein EPN41_11375 [Candidimonas sp.]|nr:MAG: hypothetical protein EPN41_11375 [Candidimonas sp.]